MKKALLIIAAIGFRDEEYFVPKDILEQNNIKVITASTIKGLCTGKLGRTTISDITLNEIKPEEYDGVFFIGGPGSYDYFNNAAAHTILKNAVKQNKIVGGICAGAAILAHAGILKGKKATSFSGVQDDLKANGATYTGTGLEIDGNIITSDGPHSADKFGNAIAKALNG